MTNGWILQLEVQAEAYLVACSFLRHRVRRGAQPVPCG